MIGVFPKGARFLSLGRPRFGKSQVARDFLPQKAKHMTNSVPGYNRSFVVQVSDDDGRDHGVYIIDQYINPRDGEKGLNRVRNQVERHLFHQWRKTGRSHAVIFEGDRVLAEMYAGTFTA